MIAEYLQQDFVLKEMAAQRAGLAALLKALDSKDPAQKKAAASELAKHQVKPAQLKLALKALDLALKAAGPGEPADVAYIPSNPLICLHQAEWTRLVIEKKAVKKNKAAVRDSGVRRTSGKPEPLDTSAPLSLAAGQDASSARRLSVGGFTEGGVLDKNTDVRYGLDGFFAKLGTMFRGKRKFNKRAAMKASGTDPLRLFLFGDWGTGLPLAASVTSAIRNKLATGDGTRRQHVIHLGDVYYTGTSDEYLERMLAQNLWPVLATDAAKTGSWSLNGNHDMYSGGHGYFDTLLASTPFKQWHSDEKGKPSSFFLIEDPHWQIFGLDTSWNVPPLRKALFGSPTLKDYGGQNGILTADQVEWMKSERDPARGCILLTHHQPASSRTGEMQQSDDVIASLWTAGLYHQIDAWIWGHEHRAVVFKPKAERTDPVLKSAPGFCCCLGHGGVPVNKKHFDAASRKPDVAWDEDRFDEDSPVYQKHPILPFGFASLDTAPGSFDFIIYDHAGAERYRITVNRT